MKKGILIEFEGLDCSFKETNSKALKEYIANKTDREVVLVSYPNYDSPSSYFIKQYLNGKYDKNPNNVDPTVSHLFYSLDRYDHWMTEVKPIYDNGGIIVSDRYTLSNIIYQTAKLDVSEFNRKYKYIDEITTLEHKIMRLPRPDIAILMDMPYEISRALMDKKNADDIHEQNDTYMKRVYSTYAFITSMMERNQIYPACKSSVISCNATRNTIKSKEEIFKNITDFVDPILDKLLEREYE